MNIKHKIDDILRSLKIELPSSLNEKLLIKTNKAF